MRTKGLELAADTTKQIITLSTGIIALTVTFAKEFKLPETALTVPIWLKCSWLLLCFAILAAIWTLMAITGTLDELGRAYSGEKNQEQTGEANARMAYKATSPNISIPATAMFLFFLAGVVTTILAALSIVR